MMRFSPILLKVVMAFVAVGMTACSSDELIGAEPENGKALEKTVEVDVHIEGTAKMEGAASRAGEPDGVVLEYKDNIPLFHIKDDNTTIKAHCVFKPLKKGSANELDNERALYGTLIFRRKKGSEPEMKDGKAVAVKILCDGKVTLSGNSTINPGEQWCVMGIVGGDVKENGTQVAVDGFHTMFLNGQVYTGVDNRNSTSGSCPFLSKWVKLEPIKKQNTVESGVPMNFKFQGVLFTLNMKNATGYHLKPTFLQVQSTELTSHVRYDLTKSNKITDEETEFQWTNTGELDASGHWFINGISLGDIYRFDPQGSLYQDGLKESGSPTLLFWSNVMPGRKVSQGANENQNSKKLPPRTGFFISCINTEAKPAYIETQEDGKIYLKYDDVAGKNYKYVLTTDECFDDILGTNSDHNNKKGKYSETIKAAPSMDFLCVKALQRSLKSQQGNYVHLTLTMPERPVLPLETMAQNNLWGYNDGIKMDFVPSSPKQGSKWGYNQWSTYAKEFDEYTTEHNSPWKLPTLKQWNGLLIQGHNGDNSHNFGQFAYDWVEGINGSKGREDIELSDGSSQTYYSVYHRPAQGAMNSNKAYGLRFFGDDGHKKGSPYFNLTRYERGVHGGKKALILESVYLGPEYAKLYDGIYDSPADWIQEISENDTDGSNSMFSRLRRDFVTRYLLLETDYAPSYYRNTVPVGYDQKMTGYYYGPTNGFSSNFAKAIAYQLKTETLFTGNSPSLRFDFTNFESSGRGTIAFIRPMRRGFVKFSY